MHAITINWDILKKIITDYTCLQGAFVWRLVSKRCKAYANEVLRNKIIWWYHISVDDRLSEAFIREFQDKVNWE
jgi:hypothetical protein